MANMKLDRQSGPFISSELKMFMYLFIKWLFLILKHFRLVLFTSCAMYKILPPLDVTSVVSTDQPLSKQNSIRPGNQGRGCLSNYFFAVFSFSLQITFFQLYIYFFTSFEVVPSVQNCPKRQIHEANLVLDWLMYYLQLARPVFRTTHLKSKRWLTTIFLTEDKKSEK